MTSPSPVRDAARGLFETQAALPPWLFYDDRGSELFEAITRLPEYDLTRVEHAIFAANADAILAAVGTPVGIVELGAGSALKSQLLVQAAIRAQGRCQYVPCDVSEGALASAVARIRREDPAATVFPRAGSHLEALATLPPPDGRWLALFVGSSIGNSDDGEATALLQAIGDAVGPGGALLLGTDRIKDTATMIAAYDDAAGVTAAFNRNVLARLNRELGADFDLPRWRHEARWNATRARIEMHLVSVGPQAVTVPGLGIRTFADGESIHTESCHKYDREHVARLFAASGFQAIRTFSDPDERFDVHLAKRAASR